jgi:hypothetical protein
LSEGDQPNARAESAIRKSDQSFRAVACLFYIPFREFILGLPTLAQSAFHSRISQLTFGAVMMICILRGMYFQVAGQLIQHGWKGVAFPFMFIVKGLRPIDFGQLAKTFLIFVACCEAVFFVLWILG